MTDEGLDVPRPTPRRPDPLRRPRGRPRRCIRSARTCCPPTGRGAARRSPASTGAPPSRRPLPGRREAAPAVPDRRARLVCDVRRRDRGTAAARRPVDLRRPIARTTPVVLDHGRLGRHHAVAPSAPMAGQAALIGLLGVAFGGRPAGAPGDRRRVRARCRGPRGIGLAEPGRDRWRGRGLARARDTSSRDAGADHDADTGGDRRPQPDARADRTSAKPTSSPAHPRPTRSRAATR